MGADTAIRTAQPAITHFCTISVDTRLVTVDRAQVEAFPPGQRKVYGQFPEGAWQQLINLMRAGADELEKRKDNDFNSADVIKDTLGGVKINGRADQ